jgi:hypothetical protein
MAKSSISPSTASWRQLRCHRRSIRNCGREAAREPHRHRERLPKDITDTSLEDYMAQRRREIDAEAEDIIEDAAE